MFNRLSAALIFLCLLSFSVSAMNSNNPFAKSESLNVGKDVAWIIDKDAGLATKSVADDKGTYYHLQYDNKQIKLTITSDAKGLKPKEFSQLEIKDVKVDGKQSPLFKWCLNNQQRHNRFLQQDLTVKSGVCAIDAGAGSFIMRLDKVTLAALQNGNRFMISLKPFRTPLDIKYDISDFDGMYVALNAKPAVVVEAIKTSVPDKAPEKMCQAKPPSTYKNIKSVKYRCNDAAEKIGAETAIARLVANEKTNQKKLLAEREKKRKLSEEKKQKELAAKLKEEEKIKAEAVAIAASEAKQAQLGSEITAKMIGVCNKFWAKGEHRCYCQKYIEHAPSEIQASSTCK